MDSVSTNTYEHKCINDNKETSNFIDCKLDGCHIGIAFDELFSSIEKDDNHDKHKVNIKKLLINKDVKSVINYNLLIMNDLSNLNINETPEYKEKRQDYFYNLGKYYLVNSFIANAAVCFVLSSFDKLPNYYELNYKPILTIEQIKMKTADKVPYFINDIRLIAYKKTYNFTTLTLEDQMQYPEMNNDNCLLQYYYIILEYCDPINGLVSYYLTFRTFHKL